MMSGEFKISNQIIIALTIWNETGSDEQIEAVVDTGFGGSLMLTQSIVETLALPQLDVEAAVLADGSIVWLPVYAVNILWDDEERKVVAYAGAGDVLLGMSMLRGCLGTFEFFPGGISTIEPAE